ncbi:MAG: glutathione S-transferase family protein [Deltaproteobacteria bacterium]|nr:glutathione S-transferase family protein [Myxococcales bacterium]MDP3215252.1 glutathione S-transferase family protein [Deltaproteobacteria bacterium]
MTIVLHRFPLSHFSEKVRLMLDFKGLDYRIVEHSPGPDQLALMKLSGQRRVPIIEHEGSVIHDSTAIALYLEHAFPEARPMLPSDFTQRRVVLDMEERLDVVLGPRVPGIATDEALRDGELWADVGAAAMATTAVPRALIRAVGWIARPASFLPPVRRQLDEARTAVRSLLLELCERIAADGYLCGKSPTLADLTAAGLTLNLKIPDSPYNALPHRVGEGVREFINDPALGRFFEWRDRLYALTSRSGP